MDGLELFRTLDLDWRLLAASRRTEQAMRRWARDPVLGRLGCLDDVLRGTSRDVERGEANALLAALVRRARDDELARRAVLQALVPGLVSVTRRLGGARDADVASDVVTEALDRIRNYPIEARPRAIAANVILDVFQHVLRRRQGRDPLATAELSEDIPAPSLAPDEPATGWTCLDEAIESGVIRLADAATVIDGFVDRVPLAEAAHRAGCKPHAMHKRRVRAMRRLRLAVGAVS